MGIEIERRFLVDARSDKIWREGASVSVFQCYISGVSQIDGNIVWKNFDLVDESIELANISTWRIRKSNGRVVLTAKGFRSGATASEFEWDLSEELYESLPLQGLPCITKTRYLWPGDDGLLWEVDEFEGALSGLVIAEVELENENQPVLIPEWASLELTNLRGWSNASLSTMIEDVKLP